MVCTFFLQELESIAAKRVMENLASPSELGQIRTRLQDLEDSRNKWMKKAQARGKMLQDIQDLRKEIEDLKKNCQCVSTTENSSLSTKITEVSNNWRSLLATLKKEAGESSEAGQIEVDEEGSG